MPSVIKADYTNPSSSPEELPSSDGQAFSDENSRKIRRSLRNQLPRLVKLGSSSPSSASNSELSSPCSPEDSPSPSPSPPSSPYLPSSPKEKRIPRPPNAFLLFRSDFIKTHKKIKEEEKRQQNISKLAGEVWGMMDEVERQTWYDKAAEVNDEHRRVHPHYKFSPAPRGSRRSKDKDQESSSLENARRIRMLREKFTRYHGNAPLPRRRRKPKKAQDTKSESSGSSGSPSSPVTPPAASTSSPMQGLKESFPIPDENLSDLRLDEATNDLIASLATGYPVNSLLFPEQSMFGGFQHANLNGFGGNLLGTQSWVQAPQQFDMFGGLVINGTLNTNVFNFGPNDMAYGAEFAASSSNETSPFALGGLPMETTYHNPMQYNDQLEDLGLQFDFPQFDDATADQMSFNF
ncbi:hypothetical protein CPC08DRAFT_718434 [Agrocybe pediades]|nr:hypothetical protein CPC08DRAFT_718434 [Agrocybe pediades]